MKYNLVQKAQLMAIKGEYACCCDFGDIAMITDGHYGYYINKNELMLDISKLKKPTSDAWHLSPENIIKDTVKASITRNIILMPSGKMAIKIKSDDGRKAWVNRDYLKQFGDNINLRISNELAPVYVSDYKGIPLGIVLPVRIYEDSEVEE